MFSHVAALAYFFSDKLSCLLSLYICSSVCVCLKIEYSCVTLAGAAMSTVASESSSTSDFYQSVDLKQNSLSAITPDNDENALAIHLLIPESREVPLYWRFALIGVELLVAAVCTLLISVASRGLGQLSNSSLPGWLIVYASTVMTIVSALVCGEFSKCSQVRKYFRIYAKLLVLFLLVWNIVGTVWLVNDKNARECNCATYKTALVVVLWGWTVSGACLLGFICYSLCGLCGAWLR